MQEFKSKKNERKSVCAYRVIKIDTLHNTTLNTSDIYFKYISSQLRMHTKTFSNEAYASIDCG